MKITNLLLVASCVVLLLGGCDKDKDKEHKALEPAGDAWMLTSWDAGSALAGKVYLKLKEDNTFELYQHIDTPDFVAYNGVYTTEQLAPDSGFILSGVYSDGREWAERYWITTDKNTMTLKVHPSGVVSVYTAAEIPDYVKASAAAAKTSRSEAQVPFL